MLLAIPCFFCAVCDASARERLREILGSAPTSIVDDFLTDFVTVLGNSDVAGIYKVCDGTPCRHCKSSKGLNDRRGCEACEHGFVPRCSACKGSRTSRHCKVLCLCNIDAAGNPKQQTEAPGCRNCQSGFKIIPGCPTCKSTGNLPTWLSEAKAGRATGNTKCYQHASNGHIIYCTYYGEWRLANSEGKTRYHVNAEENEEWSLTPPAEGWIKLRPFMTGITTTSTSDLRLLEDIDGVIRRRLFSNGPSYARESHARKHSARRRTRRSRTLMTH